MNNGNLKKHNFFTNEKLKIIENFKKVLDYRKILDALS
jgi:hypothetical protein